MKIIGLIPARMQSSRFPGKPLFLIMGKPMIYWVYNRAVQVKELDEIYIITEDEIIKNECKKLNIPCILDNKKSTVALERLSRVSRKLDGDIYLNIQGDEPIISIQAIEQIITNMIKFEDVYYLGLRSLITSKEEFFNKNTVKVVVDNEEYAMYFSRSGIPNKFSDLDNFKVLGLYGYRAEFLNKFITLPKSNLEYLEGGVEMLRAMQSGYKIKVIKTEHSSLGVDTIEDAYKVENIMKRL